MNQNNEELHHYGVPGMRWGIRRGTKALNKGTESSHNKGVKILRKHQTKITKKIGKLDKELDSLVKTRTNQIQKNDVKASKLMAESARLQKKANGIFTSEEKAQERLAKAARLDIKVNQLKAQSEVTKSEIARNRSLRNTFNKGLSEIDNELRVKGQDFLYPKKKKE